MEKYKGYLPVILLSGILGIFCGIIASAYLVHSGRQLDESVAAVALAGLQLTTIVLAVLVSNRYTDKKIERLEQKLRDEQRRLP